MLTQAALMPAVATMIERLEDLTVMGAVLLVLPPLLALRLLARQNLFTLPPAQAMRLLTAQRFLMLIRGGCKNLF